MRPRAAAATLGRMEDSRLARSTSFVALCAAALFAALLAITLVTGTSQQWFERAREPALYAERLRAEDGALRLLVGVDDVFIAFYVAASLGFALQRGAGRRNPALALSALGALAAGVLDYAENHDILALADLAAAGLDPDAARLASRASASALKWMLAHGAFFLLAFGLEGEDALTRALRAALVFLQLPVGALALVSLDPGLHFAAELMRALNLFTGFLAIAWLGRAGPRAHGSAAATGAPA
jgi:hypothetical protein